MRVVLSILVVIFLVLGTLLVISETLFSQEADSLAAPFRTPPTIDHNAPATHPSPSILDIHFTITDNIEIAWYTVQDTQEPANNRTVIVAPGITTLEFTVTRTIFSGTNSFLVMAVDNDGNATKSVVVIEEPTPGSPPICNYIPCPFDDDIVIELVWNTPEDPDEIDSFGSDLDLHFRHPNGEWYDSRWDCNPSNPNPDWGSPVSTDDDPEMVRSDDDGAGPEIIKLKLREEVGYYVRVYYKEDNDFGPSWATVRIYIEGTLIYEFTDQRLEENDFWDVAVI